MKNNLIQLKEGIKLKSVVGKVEILHIDKVTEKFIRGKKYLSAFANDEFVFSATEKQSADLASHLNNEYIIIS